mmetsp:Transcript_68137/g.197505  ORF Transcript_68137/g.197505 Transcript_68137/m.197505 type:complete len:223 (-) Transcript_68137:52-720(-)
MRTRKPLLGQSTNLSRPKSRPRPGGATPRASAAALACFGGRFARDASAGGGRRRGLASSSSSSAKRLSASWATATSNNLPTVPMRSRLAGGAAGAGAPAGAVELEHGAPVPSRCCKALLKNSRSKTDARMLPRASFASAARTGAGSGSTPHRRLWLWTCESSPLSMRALMRPGPGPTSVKNADMPSSSASSAFALASRSNSAATKRSSLPPHGADEDATLPA